MNFEGATPSNSLISIQNEKKWDKTVPVVGSKLTWAGSGMTSSISHIVSLKLAEKQNRK